LYVKKDDGAWTIPKGEPDAGEDLIRTAEREFAEETGIKPHGPYIQLEPIQQKGGKFVHAWAFEGDCDPATIHSSQFSLEWPPKSGRQMTFPEVDRAEFFDIDRARQKIKPAQMPLVEELVRHLKR
jgi:predicted NUDIX family NTP pyrophosphohydrolase